MKRTLLLLCLSLSSVVQVFAQVDSLPLDTDDTQVRVHHAFEASGSYVSLFARSRSLNGGSQLFHQPGGGFSLMGTASGTHFTFLTGITFDYTNLRQYYVYYKDDDAYMRMDRGYRARLALPVLFRLTYGRRVPIFFQVGFALGGEWYEGTGLRRQDMGHGTPPDGYPSQQGVGGLYIDPFTAGVGIKQKLAPWADILISLNGSPVAMDFTATSSYALPLTRGPYQPSVRLTVGFSLHDPL